MAKNWNISDTQPPRRKNENQFHRDLVSPPRTRKWEKCLTLEKNENYSKYQHTRRNWFNWEIEGVKILCKCENINKKQKTENVFSLIFLQLRNQKYSNCLITLIYFRYQHVQHHLLSFSSINRVFWRIISHLYRLKVSKWLSTMFIDGKRKEEKQTISSMMMRTATRTRRKWIKLKVWSDNSYFHPHPTHSQSSSLNVRKLIFLSRVWILKIFHKNTQQRTKFEAAAAFTVERSEKVDECS